MRTSLLLLGLGACADPAIDMSLQLPQMPPANFTLDCVTSISVAAIGEFEGDENRPPDIESDCIDVQGITTFADVQTKMRDQFSLAIPDSGLVGIVLRGSAGTCSDQGFNEGVFYGGANAAGDSIRIPVVPNLSCNMRGRATKVHPVDLLALTQTKQCAAMTAGRVFAADYRPLLVGTDMTLEGGTSASSIWTNGATTVETFAQAASSKTCVAVGYESLDSGGSRCVEDGQPLVCGAPGEIELPIIPFDYMFQSRDPQLVAQYGEPVLGAAWEASTAATKVPLANATVTLDDPSQGTVVYVDRAATSFVKRTGTSTGPDGLFLVYIKGPPTTITVSEPLHTPVKYKVASSPDYPATILATLARR